MFESLLAQLLGLFISIGWSLLLFLGKRTLTAMDRKMDANFEELQAKVKELQKQIAHKDARRGREIRNLSIRARREFIKVIRNIKSQSDMNMGEMEKRIEKLSRSHAQSFASRQEFGAFAANINHKIDSIYERLTMEGIKQ